MTNYGNFNPRRRQVALTTIFLSTVLALGACGRKGPLRLEPRPEPPAVSSLNIRQVGLEIELTWSFPSVMKDGSAAFDPDQIRWVRIYHADTPLKDELFRRRAEKLRKLPLKSLEQHAGTFRLRVPFSAGELENKRHFFSLQYAYHRQRSPLAPVTEFDSSLPAAAVSGLKLQAEGKILRLSWDRPATNTLGKPLESLTGYILYRRIVPEGGTPSQQEFTPLTPRPLLQERFEDSDTSREGRYEYRVAALAAPRIESVPSDIVTQTMKDTFPPATPVGVVVFRARDHLLLNWRPVADRDLSHYRIYRRMDKAEEFSLLVDGVRDTHYEDRSVSGGHSYAYQVTAVDGKGNESPPSRPVDEDF